MSVAQARLFATLAIILAMLIIIGGLMIMPRPAGVEPTRTPQPGEIFSINSPADGSWWDPNANVVILSEDTFTVTNGTQVVTMTGPITITKQ